MLEQADQNCDEEQEVLKCKNKTSWDIYIYGNEYLRIGS